MANTTRRHGTRIGLDTEARVAFLCTGNPTALGRASIRLVEITNRRPPSWTRA